MADLALHEERNCYHGGVSVRELGDRFEWISHPLKATNEDVLDAWFPPAPQTVELLRSHVELIARTSPPAQSKGLIEAISQCRSIPENTIAVGAGSSDLMFRTFLHWLTADSHVLLMEPAYGEYAYVLEQVIGCHVDRLELKRAHNYQLQFERYEQAVKRNYDLVVSVNPNNPTGSFTSQTQWRKLLVVTPKTTRVWIDECYIDYAGSDQSMESCVSEFPNLAIVKSQSKILALSGLRVGYLEASSDETKILRQRTPPWVVGMAGQVAAISAMEQTNYYRQKYEVTNQQRLHMEAQLCLLGLDVVPGIANFCMFFLHSDGPTANTFVTACQEHGLYLRDLYPTSSCLGRYAVRMAIKDEATNIGMLETIQHVLKTFT